jgi:hypothetical protein
MLLLGEKEKLDKRQILLETTLTKYFLIKSLAIQCLLSIVSGQILIINQFVVIFLQYNLHTIYYVTIYKIIHVYYLNKVHDSFDRL